MSIKFETVSTKMKISNQDQKQPTIQVATNLPIEGLTDIEMAALAGGDYEPWTEPGPLSPARGNGRGRG